MRKYHYCLVIILGILLNTASCSAGNKQNDGAKSYSLVLLQDANIESKLDNETEEVIEGETQKRLTTSIGLFTNDSIIIFNYGNSAPNTFEDITPIIFSIDKSSFSDDKSLTIAVSKDKKRIDSLVYKFDDENKILSIRGNQYELNESYFNHLKLMADKSSIISLTDILTPRVEDFYNFSPLVDVTWFPKMINAGCEILKSKISTDNPFSDSQYSWHVLYEYSSNEISHITKTSNNDGEIYLDIKLTDKDSTHAYYSLDYKEDGERLSEYGTIKRNIEDGRDSISGQRQISRDASLYNFGRYAIQRKVYPIQSIDLSYKEIMDIVAKDLIIDDKSL